MKSLKLIIAPDPKLSSRTAKVRVFDVRLTNISQKMRRLMLEKKGLGLSANQVGIDARLFIYAANPRQPNVNVKMAVNPKIISRSSQTEVEKEGCLSVPNQEVDIVRYAKISLLAQNEIGERIKIKAKGLLARVLQHEMDHLNGKLITDYI